MPEEVIQAIMARRNPRTGRNYTRDEAEAIYYSVKHKHGHKLTTHDIATKPSSHRFMQHG